MNVQPLATSTNVTCGNVALLVFLLHFII